MININIPSDKIEIVWNELRFIHNPQNGTKSIEQLKAIPDDISGIYKLFSKDKTLLYIGKAKHIRRRIHQHLMSEDGELYDYRIHIKGFSYFVVDDPVERDIYETYMINKLKPKLNSSKVYTYNNSKDEYKTEEMINKELKFREELINKFRNRSKLFKN